MRAHLEDSEQVALMQWAHLYRPPYEARPVSCWLLAIPNGGARNAREALRLKQGGVKAGVSDLFLAYVTKRHPGLWIEMKKRRKDFSTKGKATAAVRPMQTIWLTRMAKQGYETAICYGCDEAIEVIKEYFRDGR